MTLFMDTHAIDGGVKASDVAQAHLADLQTQDRYGVRYLRYWDDEGAGKIFCLVDAPDADAAIRVHREAHGLVAEHQSGDRRGMMNRRMTRFAAAPIATILLGAGMIGSAAARSDLQTGKAATSRFGIPPFFGPPRLAVPGQPVGHVRALQPERDLRQRVGVDHGLED